MKEFMLDNWEVKLYKSTFTDCGNNCVTHQLWWRFCWLIKCFILGFLWIMLVLVLRLCGLSFSFNAAVKTHFVS